MLCRLLRQRQRAACCCERVRGLSVPPVSPGRSSVEEEVSAKRRLRQLSEAVRKDLDKAEKALRYSVEKDRLGKRVEELQRRGFVVENHPESHSVFLKKKTSTGENIVIDFWEEEEEEERRVSVVIEISKDESSNSPHNLYFKCVSDDDMLGLQAVEVASSETLQSGDRSGIYGYPFDRDVSDEMKYYMMKHLHQFGVDSEIAKFANFFCNEKRKYTKVKFLTQTKRFLNEVPLGDNMEECNDLDPLGLLNDDAKLKGIQE